MTTTPVIVERVYDVPADAVWDALTNNAKMKEWYFNLDDFKPEVGFEFTFYGEKDEVKFEHNCRITEVIERRKLSYTWRYADFEGDSLVSFELFPEGDKTRLVVTHTGLESFPQNNSDFTRESFTGGWNHILGISLLNYLEKNKAQ